MPAGICKLWDDFGGPQSSRWNDLASSRAPALEFLTIRATICRGRWIASAHVGSELIIRKILNHTTLVPTNKITRLQFVGAILLLLSLTSISNAHPYASGITNATGTISFILNESADDVRVAFDNGSITNDLGPLTKGLNNFALLTHTNFSIIVQKSGNSLPTQISVDGSATLQFPNPRGVAVNANPKSRFFGRIYADNSTPGNSGSATKGRGVYVMNADASDALGKGTNAAGAVFVIDANSPYRVGVGPDDRVYVGDFSASGSTIWAFDPDFKISTNQLLAVKGDSGITAGYHGRISSAPCVLGSLSNNLVIYDADGGLPPQYNSIKQYNIGGAALPYSNGPVQLGCIGLCTISNLNTDLARGADGKLFGNINRVNYGAPNLSVFDTNGTTVLWDSLTAAGGVINVGPDLLFDARSVSISPDDAYVAVMHTDNHISVLRLTNGVPDASSLFVITNLSATTVGRSIAWDAADNIYAISSGQGLLRLYSLGLTTTAITRNDASGTNGSFQLILGPSPPAVWVQPQSTSGVRGSAASFSLFALGSSPFGYQWQFNGTNLSDNARISDSQGAALNFSSLAFSDAGAYRVIVSNSAGVVTSIVASLTVLTDSVPVWTQFPNTPGPGNIRHDDIYFTDPTNGWASQNNSIYRTTNGGASWTTNLNLLGTHFRSVAFATPMVGFAGNLGVGSYDGGVTDTNVLYRSIDGGVTWSNVPGFAEAGMKGLCVIDVLDSQHIYGAGRVRGPAFFIKSANGGSTWSIVNLTAAGIMNGIMDVYFKDANNGWVAGMDTNTYNTSCSPQYFGRIARTIDGGNTWTPVVTTPIPCSYFWKMSWPSTNIGYCALQQNASFDNIVFYKTVDGGNNWVSNAVPLTSVGLTTSQFYLQGLGFVSTNEGWIGGASGIAVLNTFLHTIDGGATWSPVGYSDTSFINRIRFLNPTLGFASGGNLHIFSAPLVITNQPQSQVVVGGTNVTLAVATAGTGPIGYQWQKNGTNRAGATTSSLTLPAVTRIDGGTYSVTVTNQLANLRSSNAVIRVIVAERLSQPVLLPGGQLQLLFNDADGGALLTTNDLATFDVLASTNLADWTVLTNALSITNGYILFQDTSTNFPARYYRVREH